MVKGTKWRGGLDGILMKCFAGVLFYLGNDDGHIPHELYI